MLISLASIDRYAIATLFFLVFSCQSALAQQGVDFLQTERDGSRPYGADDSTVGTTQFQGNPELSISPAQLTWSMGETNWKIATISNTGGFVTSPVSVSLTAGVSDYELHGNCGELAMGEMCQIQIRPKSATCGTFQGEITASADRGGTATASLSASFGINIASGTEIGRFTHSGGNWNHGTRVKVGSITVPGTCDYELDMDIRAQARYNYPVPYVELRDPNTGNMAFRTRLSEGGYGNGNYARQMLNCGDGRNRHTFRTCNRYNSRKAVQLPGGTYDVYFYGTVPRGGGATYHGLNIGFIARNPDQLPNNLRAWFDAQDRIWSSERTPDPSWLSTMRQAVQDYYGSMAHYR